MQADFLSFASSQGLLVSSLYASDKIMRCPTENKPRGKNGAYFYDGHRGWVLAWDGDGQIHWWGGETRQWTEAEKLAWIKRKEEAARAQELRNKKAIADAKAMIDEAKPAVHPYLAAKGFPDDKVLVFRDSAMILPMRSVYNEVLGAQVITWDADTSKSTKRFITGSKAKGAIFRIGNKRAKITFLCEGYATGLSIKKAADLARIDASVVVCFSAGNLSHVSTLIGGRRVVCADNDESGVGEAAAKATGLPYCMAGEVGMDFNDLHQRDGIFAVVEILRRFV